MQVLKSFPSWEGRASKWGGTADVLQVWQLEVPLSFCEGAEHEASLMRLMGDYWHGLLGLG